MTIALAALFFAAVAHSLRIRWRVAGHQRLDVARTGWVSCELWRRASLVAHVDITGRKTFPLPQETRTRVWRCVGVPLRCKVESLGLPAQVTDHHRQRDGHAIRRAVFVCISLRATRPNDEKASGSMA